MAAKPASAFVEAEGNDSDEEGHTIALDVWFSVHRITDVESVQRKFEERQLTIEELLELREEDLRSLCKEMQLDTLTKTRILNGVKRTLQDSQFAVAAPAAPSKPTDVDALAQPQPHASPMLEELDAAAVDSVHSVQHVIVSPQEHEVMEKLSRRFEATSQLTASIQKGYDEIDAAARAAKDECDENFTLLLEQMKLRQEELVAAIDELGVAKKKALQQQGDRVEIYAQQIAQVLNLKN